MGAILDAIANVLLEAVDTLILWICELGITFNMNIGTGYSTFEEKFPDAANWKTAILIAAMFIVLLTTAMKIWTGFLGPFTQSAEEPGSIVVRSVLAAVGVMASYELFEAFQRGFNGVYKNFSDKYNTITSEYSSKFSGLPKELKENLSEAGEGTGSTFKYDDTNPTASWSETEAYEVGSHPSGVKGNEGDAFLFGRTNLIADKGNISGFPLLLIELFVGGSMLFCLVKLMLEIYERYIILAVLYMFSPLAFSALVSKSNTIFKSYMSMVVSQFLLMCTNLFFIGIFIKTWHDIIRHGLDSGTFFTNSQDFVTTMFLMIAWLVTGQKIDEMMRSLNLSAAQSGSGLMGAILGGAMVARAGVNAAKKVVGGAGKIATGQTNLQKDFGAGKEGKPGGLGAAIGRRHPDSKPNQDKIKAAEKAEKDRIAEERFKEAEKRRQAQDAERAAAKAESERRAALAPAARTAEDGKALSYSSAEDAIQGIGRGRHGESWSSSNQVSASGATAYTNEDGKGLIVSGESKEAQERFKEAFRDAKAVQTEDGKTFYAINADFKTSDEGAIKEMLSSKLSNSPGMVTFSNNQGESSKGKSKKKSKKGS